MIHPFLPYSSSSSLLFVGVRLVGDLSPVVAPRPIRSGSVGVLLSLPVHEAAPLSTPRSPAPRGCPLRKPIINNQFLFHHHPSSLGAAPSFLLLQRTLVLPRVPHHASASQSGAGAASHPSQSAAYGSSSPPSVEGRAVVVLLEPADRRDSASPRPAPAGRAGGRI